MQLVIKILIILISISPAFALGEGNRNLLLIMAMGLSPLLLLRRLTLIPKIDVPIISLCFCLICFPLFTHPERNSACRRFRYAALSYYERGEQAIAAHFR